MTCHILIVEDADTCLSTLEIALSSIPGAVIHSASSAEQALDILARQPAAAVLTDLHLPGLSGFDLIQRLAALAYRPVIMVLSGDPDPSAPHRARALGADAFFAKPYSPAAVRRTLESLIHAS